MSKQLYFDTFSNSCVYKTEDIAPPERYIRVHCGKDIFIEKWRCNNGQYVNVAYTTFERSRGYDGLNRRRVQLNNNVKLSYITDWTVTEEHYKKMKKAASEG